MIKFSRKILLVGLSVFAGAVFLIINKLPAADQREKIVLNIDGKDYFLLVAETLTEKAVGLSGVHELKSADGMIFYFKPARKVSFWNKNTHFDLDLIWMKDGKVVGRDFLPSEDKAGLIMKKSPQEIDWAVEIIKY